MPFHLGAMSLFHRMQAISTKRACPAEGKYTAKGHLCSAPQSLLTRLVHKGYLAWPRSVILVEVLPKSPLCSATLGDPCRRAVKKAPFTRIRSVISVFRWSKRPLCPVLPSHPCRCLAKQATWLGCARSCLSGQQSSLARPSRSILGHTGHVVRSVVPVRCALLGLTQPALLMLGREQTASHGPGQPSLPCVLDFALSAESSLSNLFLKRDARPHTAW